MHLRILKREDLPAVLALSESLFPQIDPRRAGLERVFDNPNALALAAVDAGGGDGAERIAAFVVAIVGDAEPGGARDGGSTAAQDYQHIRHLVLEAAAAALDPNDGAPPPPPLPQLTAVSLRSARAGGPVRVGCVALLGVAPEHRRKGLARRLMRSAAAFCANLGAAALYLHTPAGNAPAVALYERRLGFVRAAFLPAYYARSSSRRDGGDDDDDDGSAVAKGGGTDAFLFVRPLFGGSAGAGAAVAAPPTPAPAASAGRALPRLLPLPFWARRPESADRPPAPDGPAFRIDDETGEVALIDEEEEEEEGEGDGDKPTPSGASAAAAPWPPQPLLQRLASAFPLGPRRSVGPPPARALGWRTEEERVRRRLRPPPLAAASAVVVAVRAPPSRPALLLR